MIVISYNMPHISSSQPATPTQPSSSPSPSLGARQRTLNSSLQHPISSSSQTGARQRTLNDFFSTTMAVSQSSNDEDHMDTEENRKRSRSSTPEDVRGPGDGSLLTNTSIRPRISSDLPPDSPEATSTPNTPMRIEQQMNNIRQSVRTANLPTIPSDDNSMTFDDSSTLSNMVRVRDLVNGVVNLTNTVANIQPEHDAPQWDNDDLGIEQNLQIVSPLPRPNIPDTPNSSQQAVGNSDPPSIADILKKTLEDSLQKSIKEAIASFETKYLGTINDLQEGMKKQTEISEGIAQKVQCMGVDVTRNINAIHEARVEIETVNRGKNELAAEVSEITGNVNRIDTGVQQNRNAISSHNEIIQALQDRVSALESRLNQNNTTTSPSQHDSLTPEELNRVRANMRKEQDNYFMSTLCIKNYRPPRDFNINRQRHSARLILQALGAEEILGDVSNVHFSRDGRSLRLTFRSQFTCIESMRYMNTLVSMLKRHNTPIPFKYNQMTPPRFSSQRDNLYRIANEEKRRGNLDRFIFLISNGQLVVKASKKGHRDWIIYDNTDRGSNTRPTQEQQINNVQQDMEIDTPVDQRCTICLNGLEQGKIVITGCRHVFHYACVKTSMEKNIECPQCKQTLHNADELIKCQKCTDYKNDGEVLDLPQLVLSRKCSHVHYGECMAEFSARHLQQYPDTPDALQTLQDANVQGCQACENGAQIPSCEEKFLKVTEYHPEMRSFMTVADLLMHNRRTRRNNPPLSGANVEPIPNM